MSFSILSQLNNPLLVLATGGAVMAGLPAASAYCTTAASLGILQGANVAAYVVNVASVSVPGRIDGQQQEMMQGGGGGSNKTTKQHTDNDDTYQKIYSPKQGRSLIAPAGWAFAIWGPIYAGEALFCASQFMSSTSSVLAALPAATAPFVATNVMQCLWCASFRPSYMSGPSWNKYVSVFMLGGGAYGLSQVHTIAAASSWFYLPLTVHFGWLTAATLVNLNGAVAMSDTSDRTVIACGHASTILGTILGVGITVAQSSPAYGITVAWALAACADGMNKRRSEADVSDTIVAGMKVQRLLCMAGSSLCTAAALASFFSVV